MSDVDSTSRLAVVLGEKQPNKWRRDSLGITALERLGLRVAYFDCEPLLRPGQRTSNSISLCSELQKIRDLLNNHSKKTVFSYYDLSDDWAEPIRLLLAATNTRWCRVVTGLIPSPCLPENARAQVRSLLFQSVRLIRRAGTLRGILNFLRERTRRLSRKIDNSNPDYLLLEGLAARRSCAHTGGVRILGHSRDYERVLTSGVLDSRPQVQDYCVFLDSNESHHDDFETLGFARRDIVDETWYRNALLQSLRAVAEATGLRVVIVPHPRARYPAGYFGPNQVCEDAIQAVASARLVLGHYSTSLGLAVIFDKPVVLFTCEPMKSLAGGFAGRYICGFQQALGCPMLAMDNICPEILEGWQNINVEKFSRYHDQYVKYPGSPNVSMWQSAVEIIAHAEGPLF